MYRNVLLNAGSTQTVPSLEPPGIRIMRRNQTGPLEGRQLSQGPRALASQGKVEGAGLVSSSKEEAMRRSADLQLKAMEPSSSS